MQKLSELLLQGHIALDLDSLDMEECLGLLTRQLIDHHLLTPEQGAGLDHALLNREQLEATCIGQGVAIPHAYLAGIPREMVMFARLREAIDYGAPDGEPIQLVFLLTGPISALQTHLQMLARLVRLVQDRQMLEELRQADSGEKVLQAIREVERRHA